MNDQETAALVDIIGAIRERGITVLLIEHDMRLVMRICEKLVVLEHGTLIAEGAPEAMRRHPAVIEAYLGADEVVNMSLLTLSDIRVRYGSVEVLHGINLRVEEGEIVTILGANGAGKSTTLLSISGLVRPCEGEILFEGKPLLRLPSHEVVGLGIAQSPEGRRVFGAMSVLENLRLGAFCIRDKARSERTLEWIFDLFPRLLERKEQLAGTLSGGEQQMLAIGRALMAEPRLLLLDEPSLGLAPLLVRSIFETVRTINERGVTVLLVEQNARAALKLAARGYVLEVGKVVMEDRAENLLADASVREAYLGG